MVCGLSLGPQATGVFVPTTKMLIVSDRPLFVRDELHPHGVPFECDAEYAASLIERGIARHASPPRVLYESKTPEQDAAALREQGVTCLCLSRNRREWLPEAIESYLAQSYAPRELLIVADGDDVQDLVPDRPDIRLIQIEPGRNIGDKRNYGVALARGRYIAHWDDDDYSAPDRILDQVDRLQKSGLPITGYSQIDFTDGWQWWRFTGDEGFAPGSSLFYERTWWEKHPFPFIQVAEDGAFVENARLRGQIVTSKSNGLLTASVHDGNTCQRNFGDRFWTTLEREPAGLSVIIPSKNIANLDRCVAAVQERESAARVIVVDDGIDWPMASLRPMQIVPGIHPFVFARNINEGIRAAGRDDVVLLNDDALLQTPGGFSLLQKAAQDNPQFGLIGSTTNNVGNGNQRNQERGLREDPRMVCFVCVFIPRSTLDKIGLLDERFTAYGYDDDDFCLRVRRAGLKIGIHDGCFVDHRTLKSTFRGDPLKPADLAGGREIFVQKWGSHPL